MKTFLKLLAVGMLALTASDSFAQTRDLGAQRLILDDGNGTGEVTISYLGPGDFNFVIPPGGATTVPMGTLAGQTLAWDGAMWQAMSNLMNDGTNVTLPTGNLTVTTGIISGDGSGITNLNASNVSTGSLALNRISTLGAAMNDALIFDGVNLIYGAPAAGSLVLPFSQSASDAGTLFSINNTGTGDAIEGISNSGDAGTFISTSGSGVSGTSTSGNGASFVSTGGSGVSGMSTMGNGATFSSSSGDGVNASSTSGNGVYGTSTNAPGGNFSSVNSFGLTAFSAGDDAISASSTAGNAGRFYILAAGNASDAIEASTDGTGNAGSFTVNNAASGSNAVFGTITAGMGAAVRGTTAGTSGAGGEFSITDLSNPSSAVNALTLGTGPAGAFVISNALNGDDAVQGVTDGGGSGGSFSINNPASAANALEGTTNGIGAAIHGNASGSADGVQGLSSSGFGIYGYSTTGTAGYFEIDNVASSAATIGVENAGTGPAIEIASGAFVGSYTTLASGGTVPANVVTVLVDDDGTGANATASVPATGVNGQIIIVGTDDADGLTIGAVSVGPTETITLTYLGGAWRVGA